MLYTCTLHQCPPQAKALRIRHIGKVCLGWSLQLHRNHSVVLGLSQSHFKGGKEGIPVLDHLSLKYNAWENMATCMYSPIPNFSMLHAENLRVILKSCMGTCRAENEASYMYMYMYMCV